MDMRPLDYLKIPTPSLTSDEFSEILVIGPDGAAQIDFEKQKSFSILIRIRDGFALTATGTLDVKIFNVNERPTFDAKIKNATYFTKYHTDILSS